MQSDNLFDNLLLGYLNDLERLTKLVNKKGEILHLMKNSIYQKTIEYENLNSDIKNFKNINIIVKHFFDRNLYSNLKYEGLESYTILRNGVFEMGKEISDKLSFYENLIKFTQKNSLDFKGEYISYN